MIESAKQRRIGVLIGYTNTVLSAFLSIIYIPILLNTIGDNEYGLYQLIGSIIAYFSTIYSSLNASVMKYYTESLVNNDKRAMENTLAIGRKIFRLLSLFIIMISIPSGYFLRNIFSNSLSHEEVNEATIIFFVMILNLLIFLNNSVYSAMIMSHERFVFRRGLDLASHLIQPIMVIAFIQKYPYALTIAVIQMILNVILAMANYIYSKRQIKVKIIFHGNDKSLIKGMISLTSSVLFVTIADQVFWKTDQIILGQQYGTKVVSIYSIGSQFNSIYISLGIVVGNLILPMITALLKQDAENDKLTKTFAQLGRYQSFLLFLILSGVVLFGKEFIYILAGHEYLPTYYVALLLMIPYTVDLIQNSGNAILQAKNLYWYRAKVLFFAAVINVIFTYYLARHFGMIGAASATTISIFVCSWIIMNRMYKKIGIDINFFWSQVIPIWAKNLIPLGFGLFISMVKICNNIYLQFCFHVTIYVVFYCIFCFFVGLRNEEKELFVNRYTQRLVKRR